MKKNIQFLILTAFVMVITFSCTSDKKLNEDVLPLLKEKEVVVKKESGLVTEADTLTKKSNTFIINDTKCYWKLMFIAEDPNGGDGTLELLDNKTHKVLLSHGDAYSLTGDFYGHEYDNINFAKMGEEGFKDINFDGFTDFMIYNMRDSGSGGDFYSVYLFNNELRTFEYSEFLSGGYVKVDPITKTISSIWKSGPVNYTTIIHHFGKSGKIVFTEENTHDEISERYAVDTYKKIIGGKIVKTTIDTINTK